MFANSGYDDTLLWDVSEVQSGNLAAGLIGSVTAVINPSANVTSTVVAGKILLGLCIASAHIWIMGPVICAVAAAPLGAIGTQKIKTD